MRWKIIEVLIFSVCDPVDCFWRPPALEAEVQKGCRTCLLTEPLLFLVQNADSRASWRLRKAREHCYIFWCSQSSTGKQRNAKTELKYQEIIFNCLHLKKWRLCDIKNRMQYYCAIHKIIRVFLGKTESTRRQWNSYGEQFEAGVLTSRFSAVSWRVCAQPRLAMAVEALVGVWVMLNGHWANGGMDQWTPVLWGRTWEPENREGSGLQTSFLSTSSLCRIA